MLFMFILKMTVEIHIIAVFMTSLVIIFTTGGKNFMTF